MAPGGSYSEHSVAVASKPEAHDARKPVPRHQGRPPGPRQGKDILRARRRRPRARDKRRDDVFSVVNGVMLRGFTFRTVTGWSADSHRSVQHQVLRGERPGLLDGLQELRRSSSLSRAWRRTQRIHREPSRLTASAALHRGYVTEDFLRILGVSGHGRDFTTEDNTQNEARWR